MVWIKLAVALVRFIGTFMLVVESAQAYPTPVDFSGKLQAWSIDKEQPVVYYETIDNSGLGEFLDATVDQAANLWSDIESSFVVLERASNERAQISLYFDQSLEEGAYSSGYAIFDQADDMGKPLHCEIRLEASYADFDKTILHELGHCIGLAHSLIPEAIMSYRNEANNFGLDTDDIAAASRLYPVDESQKQLPPGCSVGSFTSSNDTNFFVFFFFIPFIFLGILSRTGLTAGSSYTTGHTPRIRRFH